MNPFREPELLAILAAARDDADDQADLLRVAADWCEERGEAGLAGGLRLVAEKRSRPRMDARSMTWRWVGTSPAIGSHRDHVPIQLADLMTGEVYAIALRAGGGRGRKTIKCYSTYAGAMMALANAVTKFSLTQPVLNEED